MKSFDQIDIGDLREVIREAAARVEPLAHARSALTHGVTTNRHFFLGDHWQNGSGWIGPRPAVGDRDSAFVMANIESAFVSKNAVNEVITRHRNAVIGSEPAWKFSLRRPLGMGDTPTDEERELIQEAESLLTEWWDERKILSLIQGAVSTLLWGGRSYLRLFIPRAEIVEGSIPTAPLAESLAKIFVSEPKIEAATIATDESSQREISAFLYDRDGQTYAEISYPKRGDTVLAVIGGDTSDLMLLPLEGRLLMGRMRRDLFVSEQVRENQRLLNMALTMLARNVIVGGFIERVLLNAQMPGKYVTDPDDPKKKLFVADKLNVGAGSTNALVGVPVMDEKGRVTSYATPSVVYRDPVPTETFENTKLAAYKVILEETGQLHVLIAGDATASGESRRQAQSEFRNSLRDTKTQIDGMGRWLLETALALAAHLSGQTGRFSGLRCAFECRIDLGPISSDEIGTTIRLAEAAIISRETAMERVGIEDTVAEIGRIQAEMDEKEEKDEE